MSNALKYFIDTFMLLETLHHIWYQFMSIINAFYLSYQRYRCELTQVGIVRSHVNEEHPLYHKIFISTSLSKPRIFFGHVIVFDGNVTRQRSKGSTERDY